MWIIHNRVLAVITSQRAQVQKDAFVFVQIRHSIL